MCSSLWEPTSELRSVACHMGSHSVTSNPTQVNVHCLSPSQTGRYSIYQPRVDGRLSWRGKVALVCVCARRRTASMRTSWHNVSLPAVARLVVSYGRRGDWLTSDPGQSLDLFSASSCWGEAPSAADSNVDRRQRNVNVDASDGRHFATLQQPPPPPSTDIATVLLGCVELAALFH